MWKRHRNRLSDDAKLGKSLLGTRNVFLVGPHLHLDLVHLAKSFLNRIKDVLSCIRKANYFPRMVITVFSNFVDERSKQASTRWL